MLLIAVRGCWVSKRKRLPSRRRRYVVVSLVVVLATAGASLVVLRHKSDFVELAELRQARESGKPVEVVAQHTEVQRTWANPNGSFRREYSAFPKWVKTSNGWTSVDYTLAKASDGSLAPIAAPNHVTFGPGGDTFLLSMTTGGVKTALSWPTKLPAPTLDGPTATYADVVPDVDLKLTVDAGGPSQVLVVKNAKAAANPALRRFAFEAKVKDGSLGGRDGGLQVLDARGREVAVAPRPQMWDSSGEVVDMKFRHVTGAAADEARVQGPGRGDQVAAVKLDVAADRLTLSPKASLLQGGDVTYPVFIDPQIAPPKFDWAMVSQHSPSTVYYKWSNSNDAQWLGSVGSGYTQRLFWKFEVADLAGANLTKATFTDRALGSADCSTHMVSVWRTNQITPSTNWSNQPGPISGSSELSERNAATGSSCTYPSRPLEFDVEDGAQAAANANVGTSTVTKLTLRLTSDDESSSSSWVWMSQDATLSIVYVFPPKTPTGLALVDPDATCLTAPTAVTIGALAPRASAQVGSLDLDNDNLRMEFQAFAGPTITAGEATVWSEDVGGTSKAGGATTLAGTQFVSATRISGAGGAPLPAGTYVWRARAVKANDPDNYGPWSAQCVFAISDTLVPRPGLDVPAGTVWQVDDSVNVTLKPQETGTIVPANVASYRWSLNSTSAANQVIIPGTPADKRVTVAIKPDRAGPNTLRVWAYDAQGNRSVPQVLTFDTSAGVGVFSARYLLNAQPDSTSIFTDAVGTNTLTTASSLLADRGTYRLEGTPTPLVDKLMHLSGTDSPVTSTSTAVDTSKAFTVSAWVDPQLAAGSPTPPMADMTAVSQGTSTQSVFVLGVGPCTGTNSALKCYRFGVRGASGYTYVTSNRTVIQDALGTSRRMVHLIASISATGKARLYVFADGTIDKTNATLTAPTTTSTAPLVIGAERAASAYTGKWVGNIDTITVMPGVLDSPAAVQLHAKDDERCYVTRTTNDDGLTLCAN